MGKKRILIIDDELDFSNPVKKNIERTGEFVVDIAASGEEGIKLSKEKKPDLILLDILMPDMDGGDVAAKIKEDESLQDIPVIFLTGIVNEEEAKSSKLSGGCPVLAKTVTVNELIAQIKKYL